MIETLTQEQMHEIIDRATHEIDADRRTIASLRKALRRVQELAADAQTEDRKEEWLTVIYLECKEALG